MVFGLRSEGLNRLKDTQSDSVENSKDEGLPKECALSAVM
jgi:hypothetical protein